MKAVGVRELKNRLSEYLRLVKNGEEILVTDRGEVVAELRRPTPRVDLPYPGLVRAIQVGLYPSLPPLLSPGSAKRLLDEDRGDR